MRLTDEKRTMSSINKRVILVGDSGCGKSALAFRLTQNVFLDLHEPTGFDDFQTELWTALGHCNLNILDTSGNHEDKHIRAMTYRSCDAVIICFDLCKQTSLANVERYWLPEVKEHCPNVPVYITGCKKDAACEAICACNQECCTVPEGELLQLISRTSAVAYAECSARVGDSGVEDLFAAVIESSHHKRKNNANRIFSMIKKQSKNVRRRFMQ